MSGGTLEPGARVTVRRVALASYGVEQFDQGKVWVETTEGDHLTVGYLFQTKPIEEGDTLVLTNLGGWRVEA